MRRTIVLAFSLILVGVCSQNSARGQTAPPVSLAPPQASPPQASLPQASLPQASPPPAGATNSRPKRDPSPVAAPGGEVSTPVIGRLPPSPNPAADYDGFSVGTEDDDTSAQVVPPARPRAARNNSAGQESRDQDDEALKRKLMICKNCK